MNSYEEYLVESMGVLVGTSICREGCERIQLRRVS